MDIKPKKFAAVLSLALTLSVSAFAAEDVLPTMTPEQKARFINGALSVQEKSETVTSADSYSGFGRRYFHSDAHSSTSMSWDAFKGPDMIPKSEFFRLAGMDDLAEQCLKSEEKIRKKHKIGKNLTIFGGIMFAAGIVLMAVPLFDDDASEDYLWWGTGVALASCVPLGIGIYDLEYNENVRISAVYAAEAANIYNQKLAVSVTKSL